MACSSSAHNASHHRLYHTCDRAEQDVIGYMEMFTTVSSYIRTWGT